MIPTLLLAMALSGPQEDAFQNLLKLKRAFLEKRGEAGKLIEEARQAFDRGEHETAAAFHKRARALRVEAEEIDHKSRALVRDALRTVLPDLDSDDVAVRESASARLLKLGPLAIPGLEEVMKEAAKRGAVEVQSRLGDAIAKLRESEIDEEGRLRQWAADAKASSEYSNPAWCAKQAVGKPDTLTGGDHQTAWASQTQDGGEEWLELTYDAAVRPSRIRVRETFNPGAVSKLEARDADGKWHVLWEGKDANRECPGWCVIDVAAPKFATRTIKLTIDSAAVPGWNEIDAVELIGDLEEK